MPRLRERTYQPSMPTDKRSPLQKVRDELDDLGIDLTMVGKQLTIPAFSGSPHADPATGWSGDARWISPGLESIARARGFFWDWAQDGESIHLCRREPS